MTYHAMFSLYIMTGLLALVISVSLFCKSVAEAKEEFVARRPVSFTSR